MSYDNRYEDVMELSSLAETTLEERNGSMHISSSQSPSTSTSLPEASVASGGPVMDLVPYNSDDAEVMQMAMHMFGNDFYDLEYEEVYKDHFAGDGVHPEEYRKARAERLKIEKADN